MRVQPNYGELGRNVACTSRCHGGSQLLIYGHWRMKNVKLTKQSFCIIIRLVFILEITLIWVFLVILSGEIWCFTLRTTEDHFWDKNHSRFSCQFYAIVYICWYHSYKHLNPSFNQVSIAHTSLYKLKESTKNKPFVLSVAHWCL